MRSRDLRPRGRLVGLLVALSLVAALPVVLVAGAGAQTLLLEDGHFPCWSPDGTTVVCNRVQGATSDSGIFAWTVPTTGGEADTLVVDPSGVYYPQWQPDGQHIAYHRTREVESTSVYEFVVHDLQGSPAVVWPAPNFWHDAAFRLCPDGTRVIYTTLAAGRTLWVLDLASGSTAALRPGSDGALSPDGQWIAYAIDGTIAVAPFAGGAERRFEPGYQPCWTPDSRSLVFTGVGAHGHVDLILLEVEGTLRRPLTDDAELDLRSSVSPDGHTVVFVKTLDDDYGPFNLWLLDLGTTTVRPATWSAVKSAFR